MNFHKNRQFSLITVDTKAIADNKVTIKIQFENSSSLTKCNFKIECFGETNFLFSDCLKN